MELNDCIFYWISIIIPLFNSYFNIILGSSHDGYFSNEIIKKLTIPKNSFLRRLLRFKENQFTLRPLLYIRVIPFLIQIIIVMVSIPIFFINQFVISFLPNLVLFIVAGVSLGGYYIYELVLIILSRIFTKTNLYDN